MLNGLAEGRFRGVVIGSSFLIGEKRAFLDGEDDRTDFFVGDSTLFRGDVERDRCTLVDLAAKGCRGCMTWLMVTLRSGKKKDTPC